MTTPRTVHGAAVLFFRHNPTLSKRNTVQQNFLLPSISPRLCRVYVRLDKVRFVLAIVLPAACKTPAKRGANGGNQRLPSNVIPTSIAGPERSERTRSPSSPRSSRRERTAGIEAA